MSFRYGYTWTKKEKTGGGFDDMGYPIAATETDVPFNCDAQTDSGSYSLMIEGDEFKSKYFVSVPLDSDLTFKIGEIVTDHNGKDFRVVNFLVTKLARELWVG